MTGFDDTPAGALLGLSSVRQPMAEVCRLLVEHLVGRIEDPGSEPGHDLVRPEFVAPTEQRSRGGARAGAGADDPSCTVTARRDRR